MVEPIERRRFRMGLLRASLIAALALAYGAAAATADEPPLRRFEFTQTHMGMPFKLVLYAADESSANTAASAAFRRIAQLDATMSDYKPDSELSRLSITAGQGREVPLSSDLWQVLAFSQALSAKSEGAFDVTVGPYVKLWRRARRAKELPSHQRLSDARAAVGYQQLKLDPAARTARLTAPNMRLDLGGIAAGYAIDEALTALRSEGIRRALIDASGDIAVGDPPPDERGWRIGVAPLAADGPPSQYVLLANAAVTTSGDAFQFVELSGKRYSHIVDPRTGLGLTDHSSVTVIARDGITADSFATAASVLGPKRGLALIASQDGAAALFVCEVDGKAVTDASAMWKQFIAPAEQKSGDKR